jgi:hypothetical protein
MTKLTDLVIRTYHGISMGLLFLSDPGEESPVVLHGVCILGHGLVPMFPGHL